MQTLDFEPATGYVIARPITREDLNKSSGSSLQMPDSIGKVSDSVGVAEVIKCGPVEQTFDAEGMTMAEVAERLKSPVEVGDLIAFMPYTDKILEVGMTKYSVVAYKQIMAYKRPVKNKEAK